MPSFSTTLTADLGAADLVVHVNSNAGARTTYPWRAIIGSEIVYVYSGVAEGLDWSIIRGADDSDPVEHLSGARLNSAAQNAAVFVGPIDPGQVGPGNLWLDTSVLPRWWLRSLADDGWEPAGTLAPVVSLGLAVSDPPTTVQVQAISDKVDELLALMRTSGLVAP